MGNLVFPSRGLGHGGLQVPVLPPEPPHRFQIPMCPVDKKPIEPRPSAMQLFPVYQFGYRSTKTGRERSHINHLLNKQDN